MTNLASLTPELTEKIRNEVARLEEELVERRRDLHRHPELGFEETRTSGIVADALRGLGFEVRTGVAKTGVVGRLRGAKPGKTVAIRADMDALPIVDAKDPKRVPYVSEVHGKMHACGHDGHVSMALGAASVLASLRHELAGDVVFLFQPAEEGPGGAKPMIDEGVLDGVDFIFGQHLMPLLPAGVVAITEGPSMAASDLFTIRVIGMGGHGAYPHKAIDAIPIAAQIVTALQSVVSRTVDPLDAAVVTIGTVHGGYNYNVIADVVEMRGTVRTFDAGLRAAIPERIGRLVRGIAEAHGARAELEYRHGYDATVNPPDGVRVFRDVASGVVGEKNVEMCRPSMGGEDFAYYLQKVPGSFSWLGCKHPSPMVEGYNAHHPAYDMDERALPIGARIFVEGALRYLATP